MDIMLHEQQTWYSNTECTSEADHTGQERSWATDTGGINVQSVKLFILRAGVRGYSRRA
jgi:hypothetical protein